MYRLFAFSFLVVFLSPVFAFSCSILYYVDSLSGKIYAVNNEDYWYDVKPYLQIVPGKNKLQSRLWYGWKNFAQGGINEAGLFFDAATTPEVLNAKGYSKVKYNLGDQILASCNTVEEAVAFLEKKKIMFPGGHMLFGDKSGHAIVVEWIDGERKCIPMSSNRLMITNFFLSDPSKGNYPCGRFDAMEKEIERLERDSMPAGLKEIGNVVARAVQPAATDEKGRIGGTLYSTFVNITDMEFVLIYKYDNTRMTKLDLKKEFASSKKRKIKMK